MGFCQYNGTSQPNLVCCTKRQSYWLARKWNITAQPWRNKYFWLYFKRKSIKLKPEEVGFGELMRFNSFTHLTYRDCSLCKWCCFGSRDVRVQLCRKGQTWKERKFFTQVHNISSLQFSLSYTALGKEIMYL